MGRSKLSSSVFNIHLLYCIYTAIEDLCSQRHAAVCMWWSESVVVALFCSSAHLFCVSFLWKIIGSWWIRASFYTYAGSGCHGNRGSDHILLLYFQTRTDIYQRELEPQSHQEHDLITGVTEHNHKLPKVSRHLWASPHVCFHYTESQAFTVIIIIITSHCCRYDDLWLYECVSVCFCVKTSIDTVSPPNIKQSFV